MADWKGYKKGTEVPLLFPERKITHLRLWTLRAIILAFFIWVSSAPFFPQSEIPVFSLPIVLPILAGLSVSIYFGLLYILSEFDPSVNPDEIFDSYSGRFDRKLDS